MIDDNTEIQISLKTIISVIVAVVAMTSVVVRYEIKVDSLLAKIGKLEIHIQNSSKIIHENSESVRSLQIEQIKQQKDIQYITLIGETECPKK
jgi:chorismate synthase